jgi:hypothetical protein
MTKDDVPEEIKRQIIEEHQNKQRCPKCRGKWATYPGFVPYVGEVLHCHGCRKPVEKCTC